MRWSNTVSDYHPVTPNPRWGFGKPVHAAINSVLDRSRTIYEEVLQKIALNRGALHAVAMAKVPITLEPFWNNQWFSCLDAASLVDFCLIAVRRGISKLDQAIRRDLRGMRYAGIS